MTTKTTKLAGRLEPETPSWGRSTPRRPGLQRFPRHTFGERRPTIDPTWEYRIPREDRYEECR